MKTKTLAYLISMAGLIILVATVSLILLGMGERDGAAGVGGAGGVIIVLAAMFLPMIIDDLER